ncbi:MAG: carboxypeptidase regulatory-like domain-containing protein [Gemmatimonadaceae bacterium]|nr:carboxypeptidase regulatory-like domain-containing protein [Gemmatimonadaceae bacterium]
MRTLWVSLACVLVAQAPAAAQGLRGSVVDSTGRPLADAEIIVVEPAIRTRSDSLGSFRLSPIAPGRRVVRVRLIGYRPYETTISITGEWTTLRVTLRRMPTLLAEVRITDTRLCAPNTLAGFECRRSSGLGLFRDAGELRSLRPSAWADMLDGMPALRREPTMTPDGLDWRPAAPPGGCLRQIFNGEDPEFDGHVRRVPISELVPQDVVAIEYYPRYAEVPEQFRRYAWPSSSAQPCALLVYWLREAPPRRRSRPRPPEFPS